MIKPLLNPTSVSSIKVFGSNRDEWVPALLEEIDADQLPVYYGGTMLDEDGNPKCPGKVFQIMSTDTNLVNDSLLY